MTLISAGAGDAVLIGGFGTIYKVPGETTNGVVAVVEHILGAAVGCPVSSSQPGR